jgi:hypothetical protein
MHAMLEEIDPKDAPMDDLGVLEKRRQADAILDQRQSGHLTGDLFIT